MLICDAYAYNWLIYYLTPLSVKKNRQYLNNLNPFEQTDFIFGFSGPKLHWDH